MLYKLISYTLFSIMVLCFQNAFADDSTQVKPLTSAHPNMPYLLDAGFSGSTMVANDTPITTKAMCTSGFYHVTLTPLETQKFGENNTTACLNKVYLYPHDASSTPSQFTFLFDSNVTQYQCGGPAAAMQISWSVHCMPYQCSDCFVCPAGGGACSPKQFAQ